MSRNNQKLESKWKLKKKKSKSELLSVMVEKWPESFEFILFFPILVYLIAFGSSIIRENKIIVFQVPTFKFNFSNSSKNADSLDFQLRSLWVNNGGIILVLQVGRVLCFSHYNAKYKTNALFCHYASTTQLWRFLSCFALPDDTIHLFTAFHQMLYSQIASLTFF